MTTRAWFRHLRRAQWEADKTFFDRFDRIFVTLDMPVIIIDSPGISDAIYRLSGIDTDAYRAFTRAVRWHEGGTVTLAASDGRRHVGADVAL